MVGSFYDPVLDEGCAFEELISFHGGLGGPQTRPFILLPAGAPAARRADRRRRGRARAAAGLAGGAAGPCPTAGPPAAVAAGVLRVPADAGHGPPAAASAGAPSPGAGTAGGDTPQGGLVLVLLVLAAILGVVASLAAWCFLELAHQANVGAYE